MGNSNGIKEPQTRFTEIAIEENELLSNLLIVEDKLTKERFMVKQMNIANQFQFNRILKEMRMRKAMSEKKLGKYLIRIRDIETKESNEICGKNYKIILYLEYLETTLKKVYNQRLQLKQYFSEEQILALLLTLVNNLIILHDNNYKNIHIYKECIFRNDTDTYKIIDTQMCTRIHPYFELLNNVPTKKGTYLAPELLQEIRNKNGDFYQTPKADIFTLAIIMLELCSFSSYDSYYDFQEMRVDLQGLREAVQQIDYSNELKCILEMMLTEEQQERIGLITLKEILLGNDKRSYQESSTFKSVSTSHPKRKNTTRTFISRSKPQQKISKENSLQKINTDFQVPSKDKPQLYPISSKNKKEQKPIDYSSQRQMVNESSKREQIVNSKRSLIDNKVVYKPIECLVVQQGSIVNQIRQTPRSSFGFDYKSSLSNKFKLREFQTPVNMLYQPHQPESTPIRKIQAINSAKQPINNFTLEYLTNKTYGQHVFSNGAKYEGQFNSNNQFEGNGMLYYPNGKLCYSGSWKQNKFHGFGVLYNESPSNTGQISNYDNFNFVDKNNWNYYEGQFDNDRKQGFGTLYIINGDKFSGCFKNDLIQGFGTFYLAKQNKNINGIWVKNMLKR